MICGTCDDVDYPPPALVTWNDCSMCGDWAWCHEKTASAPSEVDDLRRKLKRANRDNEDLRQTIKFQRDALTSLGQQFIKLSTLLKEQND